MLMPNQVGANPANIDVGPSATANVVTPAANTNGLIIKTLSLGTGPGGSAIFVGPTPPSGIADFSKLTILYYDISGGAGWTSLAEPLSLPAGYGVWLSAGASGGSVRMTYDLIS
jgi:hypothetical protein